MSMNLDDWIGSFIIYFTIEKISLDIEYLHAKNGDGNIPVTIIEA